MLKLRDNEAFKKSNIDLLVGGTPCQSFSIAGLRGGLADSRGNLALEFCRILAAKRPKWFVWENVPGVLSSKKGEDLRSIFQGFSECGYSFSWRILDAKFFGVPQRRRRVFVVGYLGDDWRPPAAVLFEPQSLRGNPSTGRKERQEIAGTLDARIKGGGFDGSDGAMNGHIVSTLDASYAKLQGASGQDANHGHSHLVAYGGSNTSGPIAVETAIGRKNHSDFEADTFIVSDPPEIFQYKQSSQGSMNTSNVCPTLHKGKNPAVFTQNSRDEVRFNEGNVTGALSAQPGMKQQAYLLDHSSVRRLTPLECERLQGFPDRYTAIPGAKDSPRYSAIGNSMACPVMAWIGRRIDYVDKQLSINKG